MHRVHRRYRPANHRVVEKQITEFSNPLELLYAVREAVASEFSALIGARFELTTAIDHREHWRRGKITDGITPNTIFIHSSASFGTRGTLRPRKLISVGDDDRNVAGRVVRYHSCVLASAD